MFLIIDDSFVDRMIAKKILEFNFSSPEIAEVCGAQEGITWLKSNVESMNRKVVILLDIRMPELSGFDFLDLYTTLPEKIKQKVDIIMLSSTLDANDMQLAESHQYVKTLLEKPLDPKQLANMLTEVKNPS